MYIDLLTDINRYNRAIIKIKNIDNSYFGLSPKINEKTILDLLNIKKIFNSEKKFINYCKKNYDKYFYISEIYLNNNFINFIKNYNLSKIDIKNIHISLFARSILCASLNYIPQKNTNDFLDQKIVLTDEIIKQNNYVENLHYCLNNHNDKKIWIGPIDDMIKNKSEYTYKLKSYIGNVSYYNGVIPRLVEIKNNSNETDLVNENYIHWELKLQKTTYFTIASFENIYINNHFLLKKFKKFLDIFDQYNINSINIFLERNKTLNYFDSLNDLDQLNIFLKNSLHTNNIGVTGNIYTIDNILLFSKRGKKSIDKNQLYPSINGNCEIYDKNVEFYDYCNFEDKPTIDYKNMNNSFNDELTRETIAELNISNFSQDWKYKAISILIDNDKRIKFQFNIIANTNAFCSFDDIVKCQINASENFENEQILGINILEYKSKSDFLLKSLRWILTNSKTIISFIISIISFILLVLSIKERGNNIDINNVISIISFSTITFISILILIIELCKYIKKRRVIKKQIIFKNKLINKLSTKFNNCQINYVTNIAYYVFLKSKK